MSLFADEQTDATATNDVLLDTRTYSYTGNYQTWTVEKEGLYEINLYGASGGYGYGGSNGRGEGGYTRAQVYLKKGQVLYIYCGGQGVNQTSAVSFNGGGASGGSSWHKGGQGGGATDIRLVNGNWNDAESLKSRILVAGGGGGAQSTCGGTNTTQGNGGGLTGAYSKNTAGNYSGHIAWGGSQTEGGSYTFGNSSSREGYKGSFGIGANAGSCGAGGGGGYYGGGSVYTAGGGGGSSFVSGYNGCDTTYRNKHTNIDGELFQFSEVLMQQGGNYGNGYVKISLIYTENNYEVNNYEYSGKIETVTLQPGTYTFEAWGAQGGQGTSGYTSGKGAYARSTITITEQTTYKILVGEKGKSLNASTGSGGGGTFIATEDNTPIAVAGGGGGAYGNNYSGTYYHGQASRMSSRYNTSFVGQLTEGQGGFAGYSGWSYPSTAGAGGGFYGNGMYNSYSGGGSAGYSFVNGGGTGLGYTSGVHGGFGGGGGTNYVGGGGGGYTGGSAGTGHNSSYHTGAGGGSYYTSLGTTLGGWQSMPSPTGGYETGHTGNGYVRITKTNICSLNYEDKTIELQVDENYTIDTNKLNNRENKDIGNLSFESLNTDIATVTSEGVIKGIAEGKTK